MNSDEFVLAINPDPIHYSVRVERAKYDLVREAILDAMFDHGPMTFKQLGDLVEDHLRNNFDDSVKWYYTIVRQDMEVRGELRRAPKFRFPVSQIL